MHPHECTSELHMSPGAFLPEGAPGRRRRASSRAWSLLTPDISSARVVFPGTDAESRSSRDLLPLPFSRDAGEPDVVDVTVDDLDIGNAARLQPDEKNCKNPLQVDSTVEACFETVKELCTRAGGSQHTVSPLMLSRCMRGGKPTVLCKLFDRLEKEEGFTPIFTNLNAREDPLSVARLPWEKSPIECMRRAVAWSLMDRSDVKKVDKIRCSEGTLERWLEAQGERKIVLLIDELNVLLSREETVEHRIPVRDFLCRNFLDKKNRYLVFTTHYPIDSTLNEVVGPSRSSASKRGTVVVDLPQVFDVKRLQRLEGCSGVTKCFAAYYAFVPSIIYEVCQRQAGGVPRFDFSERFRELWTEGMEQQQEELRDDFVSEFFSGDRVTGSPLRAFDALTYYTASKGGKKVNWILGYVSMLCTKLGWGDVASLIEDLKTFAKEEGGGKEWETIVNIAIALRCKGAVLGQSPFGLLPGWPDTFTPARSAVHRIPSDKKKCKDALKWYRESHTISKEGDYADLLVPAVSGFAVLDSILILGRSGRRPTMIGYQQKAGKHLPKKAADVPRGMHCYVLRGKAPEGSSRSLKKRWQYLGKPDALRLLGRSLSALYPGIEPEEDVREDDDGEEVEEEE
eukprot:TRINITY_DN407_c1_g1_i6.p1 TRINITY_DN407_c1_g1~~TRINITY_DN407_c1_g1_i6.p1  ORF type:complete len:626 (+),score=168.85 TRINITY_DN407_c1_g1_i6:178-2055(+)